MPVARESDVGFLKETVDELRTQRGAEIEKPDGTAGAAPFARIVGQNLAAPLRLQEIPVGLDLLWAHKLRVVSDQRGLDRAVVQQHVLSFSIGEVKFFSEPERLIGDLGQD